MVGDCWLLPMKFKNTLVLVMQILSQLKLDVKDSEKVFLF